MYISILVSHHLQYILVQYRSTGAGGTLYATVRKVKMKSAHRECDTAGMSLFSQPSYSNSPWWLVVLEGTSWHSRLNVMPTLSAKWRMFAQESYYSEWLCGRLREEHGVYVPLRPPRSLRNWTTLFRELYPLRNMWLPSKQHVLYRQAFEAMEARRRFLEIIKSNSMFHQSSSLAPNEYDHSQDDEANRPESRYSVGVCVRFRPNVPSPRLAFEAKTKDGGEEARRAAAHKARFLLPLHQRLQIIKSRHKCDTKEALKILKTEGAWFDSSWKKRPVESEDKENAPFQGVDGQNARVQTIDQGRGLVVMVAPSVGMRPFHFDHVLHDKSSQSSTYEVAASSLVMDMCNGYNSSIIMYGQTGSGKTYTCFGPPGSWSSSTSSVRKNRGLVIRVCEEVFEAVEKRKASGISSQLYVSYVEVYGNEVTDLLRKGTPVGHNKVSAQRYVMQGQAKQPVGAISDIDEALERGEAQKRRAATAMNDRSSRAHTLFVLSMEMNNSETGVTLSSQMILADLGGSEQVKRSKVHHGGYDADTGTALGFQLGDHMREAVNINLGLLALKKCISALNEGASYVPYQDSKLTMLLSPAIGGDSKATVMVCCSQSDDDSTETLQALRFGEKCSTIQNAAGVNSSAIQDIIEAMDEEIATLEATIKRKERWESREVVREDNLVEEGTYEASLAAQKGGEVVRTGVIVGAEEERRRLEEVIIKRAELTGEDVNARLAEAGFGGMYGGEAKAEAGNAQSRFSNDQGGGLKIKGKKVAEWKW